MPKRGSRFRRPSQSECFAFIGWEAVAATVKSGKRDISPGSRGVITIIFRRKYPRYRYVCKRRTLTYAEWQRWATSASPGEIWNYEYKGAI